MIETNDDSLKLVSLRQLEPHWRMAQAPPPTATHRSNIARAIGTTHTITQRGRMFWLWWKTLAGSYVVFTSTSRS